MLICVIENKQLKQAASSTVAGVLFIVSSCIFAIKGSEQSEQADNTADLWLRWTTVDDAIVLLPNMRQWLIKGSSNGGWDVTPFTWKHIQYKRCKVDTEVQILSHAKWQWANSLQRWAASLDGTATTCRLPTGWLVGITKELVIKQLFCNFRRNHVGKKFNWCVNCGGYICLQTCPDGPSYIWVGTLNHKKLFCYIVWNRAIGRRWRTCQRAMQAAFW